MSSALKDCKERKMKLEVEIKHNDSRTLLKEVSCILMTVSYILKSISMACLLLKNGFL